MAILAGFSLAAAVDLTHGNRSWAQDTALIFFTFAVAVLITALRFIIAAQAHLSAPSDYLSWRPEAGRDPGALHDERDRQVRDHSIFIAYRIKAVKIFPIGVASALLGLGAACLNALARHADASSVITGCIAASVLLLGGVIALLEVWNQPKFIFPSDDVTLNRVAAQVKRKRDAPPQAAEQALGQQQPVDPNSRLPDALQSLPLDVPALTAALGDDFVTPPLLTPSSRTIGEFAQFLPAEIQQETFRLACQRLAYEFGGYSTTRTSVLFTVTSANDSRAQVIVALHPGWSEIDERGVAFEASSKLISERSKRPLAEVEERLGNFPQSPFQSAGCRLLDGPLSVDSLIRIIKSYRTTQ